MAMKPKTEITFEIAFGEGQIFDGEPVVETLTQLIDLVERVVGIFERRALLRRQPVEKSRRGRAGFSKQTIGIGGHRTRSISSPPSPSARLAVADG